MRKLKKLMLLFTINFLLLIFVVPVFAASSPDSQPPNFSSAQREAAAAAQKAGVTAGRGELEPYVAQIINIALSLVGVIFLMLMVYGGYVWMMAKGDEAEAKKAQGIITMAIIGIIVVIAAYAVSKFIVDRLIGAAA